MRDEQQQVVDRFWGLLRPIERDLEVYCRRLVWNEHDALDAIQDAVLSAFKAFDRYHDAANFRGWMFKILTHAVFKLNRKFARLAQSEFQVEPEALDALPALEQCAAFTDWLNSPD